MLGLLGSVYLYGALLVNFIATFDLDFLMPNRTFMILLISINFILVRTTLVTLLLRKKQAVSLFYVAILMPIITGNSLLDTLYF